MTHKHDDNTECNEIHETTHAETPKARGSSITISRSKLIAFAVALVIISIAYACKGLFIAATVNGSPISRFSVLQELEKSAGQQVLSSLITKKLINDAAQKKGITVSDKEVTDGVNEIRRKIAAKGSTLEEVLVSQGVSMIDFTANQRIQIEVEKLLGDKIAVTDKEIDEYIAANKLRIDKDKTEEARTEIRDLLKSEKLSTEGQNLVNSLRTTAKISYFVEYGK